MNENSGPFRPIWLDPGPDEVKVIDQRALPHKHIHMALNSVEQVIFAIKEMVVRGAPLIGVTGAYGIFVAVKNDKNNGDENYIKKEAEKIINARPTAVNLCWGVNRTLAAVLSEKEWSRRVDIARRTAGEIAEEEVENSRNIGQHGVALIAEIARKNPGKPLTDTLACPGEAFFQGGDIFLEHRLGDPVSVFSLRQLAMRITSASLGSMRSRLKYSIIRPLPAVYGYTSRVTR